MKFVLILAAILGIGYYAAQRYGDRLGLIHKDPPAHSLNASPTAAPSAPVLALAQQVPSIPGASSSSVAPSAPASSPPVSAVVQFRHRPVPPAAQLAPLVSSGGANGSFTTSIVVDPVANCVLIRGAAEAVEALQGAIQALDVEAMEAFCDAWMLFVRGDRVRDFEAAFEWGPDLPSGSASYSADGFGVSVPLGACRARLQWLASNGIVEVVDRPQLRLSSGHKSEVSTGDEVPFPTTTIGAAGVAQTSITFKRVGLNFSVLPLFLGGSRVRLEVEAENGLLGGTQRIGDVEVPQISRQSVTGAATLGFDEAMVIGGLESVRRERRFGLLGTKEHEQAGRLYVAIMLRSGYPRAKPVIGPDKGLGIEVPGVTGEPGRFGESLLPPRGWSDFPDGVAPVGSPLPEK